MNWREWLGVWAFSIVVTAAVAGWAFLSIQLVGENAGGVALGVGVPLLAWIVVGGIVVTRR